MIHYLRLAIICLFIFSGIDSLGQTYCNPSYPNGCSASNNRITNVQIGTINHAPPGCTVHDYTSLSTLIAAGVPTPIDVISGGWCAVGVAVDLNSNGSFDDPGEIMALPSYIGSQVATYSMSITIPAVTTNGSYRMRVYNRLANSGNGTPGDSPCGVYGYGSWDDYTLIVYHLCPTITSVAASPSQLCGSGTSSLSCVYTTYGAATVKWYSEAGTLVGSGNPLTTPMLTTTTTFYAAVDNGTCDTPRVPITVIVVPPVVAPLSITPLDTTICEGKIVTIQATRSTMTDSVIAKQGAYTATKMPINGTSTNSASELIYTSGELNITGSITDIAFYKKSTNTTFNPGNVSIYMKNTTASAVATSTSLTGYVLVYSGAWPNAGVAANTWANITLNSAFDYLGGTNNLSVLIVRSTAPSSPVFAPTYRASSTSPVKRSSYYIATTPWTGAASAMTTDTLRPDIKIKYQMKPVINWSPVTNLFKDGGLTLAMNSTDTNSLVYAHPNTTTNYNAYSNLSGCLSSGFVSSHIVVKDTVHITIVDSVCAGAAYTFGIQTLTSAGSYTQSFQAVNACDSVVTLNLTIRPYITNTIAVNICQGQSYVFNNVTYTTSQTGLKDTFSTSGCDSIVTLSLTVSANVTPTFAVVAPICTGSIAPVLPTTSTNSYTGTWSPATVSNTATTIYTFTPNAGQCATTATLTVTVNPNVTPAFNAITPICSGSTPPVLPAISTNGIAGTWNPATVSNIATATYTFTPNVGICATTATLTVTVNPNVTPTFTTVTPICNGSTAPVLPLTSNNGITGTWNPATVNNTATTTYTFTPIAGLCATTATLIVTVNSNVVPVFTLPASICNGATAPSLPLTSTNGITGTWNPATASNTTTGTYVFTPTAGICATPLTITINVNNNTLPVFPAIASFCGGTTAPLLSGTSTNGIAGTWNPATINNTTSGVYTFTPNTGLCALPTTLNVVVKTHVLHNDVKTICANQVPYSWNGINNAVNGTTYTTTSANGCDSIVTLQLTVLPAATIVRVDSAGCGFVWYYGRQYNNNTTISDTFRNFLGCDSFIRTTHITVYPNTPYTKVIDSLGCDVVSFEGANYRNSITLIDTFKNRLGCDSVRRVVNITVVKFQLSLSVTPEDPYKGELIHLVSSANDDNYNVTSWTPPELFPAQTKKEYSIRANADGVILIEGTDAHGCTDTAEVRYAVKPVDYGVFIPNAFTPNGDGSNDKFGPIFYMKRAFIVKVFHVFNRYGQSVYSAANTLNCEWDGLMNNGNPADIGNYKYFIEIRFVDGKEVKLKGDVTLLR